VVEVLSPNTRQLDSVNKKRVYARMGVKELWIIDPDQKEVAVYRFDQDPQISQMTKAKEFGGNKSYSAQKSRWQRHCALLSNL
jgi:Uma2 family endonuclease